MKTKITKSVIKKALEFITEEQIIIVSSENFISLYKNSLVPAIHGKFNNKRILIYSCGLLDEIYEKQLKEMFPNLVVICMK